MRNGSILWFLLGMTQLWMTYEMMENLSTVVSTLFGSTGAALLFLGGYFFIQEKRNHAWTKEQGYLKDEKTELFRDEKGDLNNKPVKSWDLTTPSVIMVWFIIMYAASNWIF